METRSSYLRSSQNPLRRVQIQQSCAKLPCLECRQPLTTRHHCIFCTVCLSRSAQAPTVTRYSPQPPRPQTHLVKTCNTSDSMDSDDSDITAWNKDRGRPKTPRNTSSGEILVNTSLGHSYADDNSKPMTSKKPRQHWALYGKDQKDKQAHFDTGTKEKLDQMDLRATRCGMCYAKAPKRLPNTFCVHCRKYLCVEHTKYHRTFRLLRHHGLINLKDGLNQALG